ncbi:MAG: alpha/beta hydrolase [Aestuariibacter sp.]
MRLIVFLLVALQAFKVFAGSVFSELPQVIDPNARYLFYSHGYIVEGSDAKPEHPRWGVYDFPAILDTLSEFDANIIAEHRAAETNPFEHAKKLQKQVQHLIDSGVSEKNISLVGFSRGGFITAITSSYLANKNLNYVILAACTSSLADHDDVVLYGNILSVYETSDAVGSCEHAVERSAENVVSFTEIAISTGREHGAFYRPIDAWVKPVKNWWNKHEASVPYSVPRSEVIKLVEPSSQRVYPLYIKLPRSYKHRPNARYPVIYLTDALYSFPLVSGATRFPMNSGSMQEAIIVAISYSQGSRGSSSRVRDFTPSVAQDWKMKTGNAEGHLAFFKDIVFPYVESKYRIDPENRTYAGNSLGGLFGAYVLFISPETFSSYIIGSPSVWFNDNYLLSLDAQKSTHKTKVYLSVGSLERPQFGEREDMVQGAKLLAEKIQKESPDNVILNFRIIDGASHSTAFPTTLIQGLDWIHGKK